MNRKMRKELRRLGFSPSTTKIRLSDCSPRLFWMFALRNERITRSDHAKLKMLSEKYMI